MRKMSKIYFVFFVLIFGLVSTAQAQSLVFWNKLDGEVDVDPDNPYELDSVIGVNLVSGIPITDQTFEPGKFGNGFNPTSTSQPAGNTLLLPANVLPWNAHTMEFWFKRTGPIDGAPFGLQFFLSSDYPETSDRMSFVYFKNGKIVLSWRNVSSGLVVDFSHDYGSLAELEAALPLNVNVHLAVTKESDGTTKMYIDGIDVPLTVVDSGSVPFSSKNTGFFDIAMHIGARGGTVHREWAEGVIDNFKIYDYAKTEVELATEILLVKIDDLLSSGAINEGNHNALTTKVVRAIDKIERGKIQAGTNSLEAFINQMEALVNSGKLTPEEADLLIDSARSIIEMVMTETWK